MTEYPTVAEIAAFVVRMAKGVTATLAQAGTLGMSLFAIAGSFSGEWSWYMITAFAGVMLIAFTAYTLVWMLFRESNQQSPRPTYQLLGRMSNITCGFLMSVTIMWIDAGDKGRTILDETILGYICVFAGAAYVSITLSYLLVIFKCMHELKRTL